MSESIVSNNRLTLFTLKQIAMLGLLGLSAVLSDALSGANAAVIIEGVYQGDSVTLSGPIVISAGSGGTGNAWEHGINITSPGWLTINGDTTITVDSVAGSGVRVNDAVNSEAILNGDVNISLVNPQNTGINNINEAAALYANNGAITVTGKAVLDAKQGRGYGLWAIGDSADISIVGNTSIATHGREGFGIRLDGGSITLGGDLSIVTGLNPAAPDALDGVGSAGLRAIGGTMEVAGPTSVKTVGGIALVGSTIQAREAAYGLWNTVHASLPGNGGDVRFNGAVTIETAGAAAHGIYNNSRTGIFTFADTVNITTTGGMGSVTWIRGLLSIPVNETVGAWGVNNEVSGVTTFQGALSIDTSGEGSGGIRSAGGKVDVQSTVTIIARGDNAYGLWASSLSSRGTTYNGVIDVGGHAAITTTGAGGHGVYGDQNGKVQMTGGATLRVADPAAKGIFATDRSSVTGSGYFDVIADLQSSGNATLDLAMNASSRFTGATTQTNTSIFNLQLLQNSVWNMTASSNLTSLANNASMIEFLSGGSFKTLTTGSYAGTDGAITLNTFLDTDDSPSDRLVIDGGSATGSTLLYIANAGGNGNLTTGNGILVVDTISGGATDIGAFTLGNRVVAGPYEYTLWRANDIDPSTGNPEAWYLRSEFNCALAPTSPECQTSGTSLPYYRDETSVYAALPSMALLYGRNLLDTLHERVGEEEDIRGRSDLHQLTPYTGGWGRIIGAHGQHDGDAMGVYGSGPAYNYDFIIVQAGQDLFRAEHTDGSRDHIGFYLAYGHAKGTVTHVNNRTGANKFNAYTLGGYWTHFGPTGWYIDTVLQGTRYDTTSTANLGLPDLNTHGNGLAVSLEGGKPYRFDNGCFIEPQAQLIYQTISFDDASDTAALVSFSDVESFVGRIGARIGHTWLLDGKVSNGRQVTAWIRPNLWYEFRGNPVTRFSLTDGLVPFHADLGGGWSEINFGVSGQISRNVSLIVNASYNRRLDGNGYSYDGKVGLRVNW